MGPAGARRARHDRRAHEDIDEGTGQRGQQHRAVAGDDRGAGRRGPGGTRGHSRAGVGDDRPAARGPQRRPRRRDRRQRAQAPARQDQPRRREADRQVVQGTALCAEGLRPVAGRAEGEHLRLGPHAREPRRLPPGRRLRQSDGRGGVDGHHRRRRRHHGRGPRRGRGGAVVRAGDPTAVRAEDQPVHRERPEADQLQVLLHPQADVPAVQPRDHALPRRVRDDGRGVRGADARADRQERADPDRDGGQPRRTVLAGAGRTTSATTCSPAA